MLRSSFAVFESQDIRAESLVSFGARVANAESCGRAFVCVNEPVSSRRGASYELLHSHVPLQSSSAPRPAARRPPSRAEVSNFRTSNAVGCPVGSTVSGAEQLGSRVTHHFFLTQQPSLVELASTQLLHRHSRPLLPIRNGPLYRRGSSVEWQ